MPALSPTMSQGNIANWQVRKPDPPRYPHAGIAGVGLIISHLI